MATVLFVCIILGGLALILTFLYFCLPPESRYGIDEHGNAKTPEYMAQKKAEQKWFETFEKLDP